MISLAAAAARASIVSAGLSDYNLTGDTALGEAKDLSMLQVAVVELGLSMTCSYLLKLNHSDVEAGDHVSAVPEICTPDTSLPFELEEYC
jgi:hypothetical protein